LSAAALSIDFIRAYNPANRHERQESERFRPFVYDDLAVRDGPEALSPVQRPDSVMPAGGQDSVR